MLWNGCDAHARHAETFSAVAAAALLAALFAFPSAARAAPSGSLAPIHVFILQGEGARARGALNALDPAVLSADERRVHRCMSARLERVDVHDLRGEDAWVVAVLNAYRDYWRRALLSLARPETLERRLAQRLQHLLQSEDAAGGESITRALDELEPRLQAALSRRGLHSQLGVTRPFRELMIWHTEWQHEFEIALPVGKQTVPVSFMDGFLSLGWADYATCGERHTGGWSTAERLHAVRTAYELHTEEFRVSYLAHEGQHLVDLRAHPELDQEELEYRAKLVELSIAHATLPRLLAAFASNMQASGAAPHSVANHRVIHDLARALFGAASPSELERLAQAPASEINAAAAHLLRAHVPRT